MIIYIILVALLNLCVGYYAAVHLGFGRTWWSAGQAPDASKSQAAEQATDTIDAAADPVEQPLAPGSESAAPEPEPSSSAAFEELAAASDLNQRTSTEAEEASEEASEMLDAKDQQATQEESQATPPAADNASSEPSETSELPSCSSDPDGGDLDDNDLEASDLDEDVLSVVEACVTDFKRELGHYRAQLGEIESLVREGAESGRSEQLQQCVEGLRNANTEFLDKQGEISQRLNSQEDRGGFSDVAADVGRAMAEQGALAKFSNINIEQIDAEKGLETGFQRLIGETSVLSDNASRARQTLEDAEESIAEARQDRDEAKPPADEEALQEKGDPAQQGQRDVKQALDAWWKDDPQRSRDLTIGVIDVDKAAQLREQLGRESTDKLFEALTSMIEDAVGQRGPVIRHSFHVFVVLLHDTEPRESTNVAEHVRQTVAAANFTHQESRVAVTVSCVVTPARHDDSAATIVQRIDTMLEESSRYGENRTYLHEDDHPSPVVPPQLDVEEVTVRL